jgi:hypothetical protein
MSKKKLPDLSARSNTYKSSAKMVNTRFYILFSTLFLSAILGALGFIGSVVGKDVLDLSSSIPAGKSQAEEAAKSFISGKRYTIGFAQSFSENYDEYIYESKEPLNVEQITWSRFKKTDVGENHYFTIKMKNIDNSLGIENSDPPLVFELIVVLVNENNEFYLASLPYLVKKELPPTTLFFDYGNEDILDNLSELSVAKIGKWAEYWASDDRVNLQNVTSDDSVNNEYVGLGNFKATNVEILSGTPLNVEEGNIISNYNDWLLRVRVSLTHSGGFSTTLDIDITLTNAETSSPLIVAWGEAGVGVLEKGANSRVKS